MRIIFKETNLLVLGLVFISVTILIFKNQNYNPLNPSLSYYKNNNYKGFNPKPEKNYNMNRSPEIQNILTTTTNLWRQFTFLQNETVASRVESQRQWIRRIFSTDFIKSARVKRILLQDITPSFNYYFTENKVKCPYAPNFENRCELTVETAEDRLKGPLKYEGYDACVGIRRGGVQENIEEFVPEGVQQIFYILEPPHHANNVRLGKNNALLASYWRGSDIIIPYREWSPKNADSVDFILKKKTNKTKHIAALISNCNRWDVKNDRLGYINELKKYVDVEIYGRCGDLECPKDCKAFLESNYKFYLAFENGNCEDYITEKFFVNGLSHEMIPIVMGARDKDYKSASPPNSYIHVDSFESPKALAEYVHLLDKNDDLYREYFKWKSTSNINRRALEDFFCRVCGMLFYADFIPPPSWESERTLFSDVNKCLPRGQWHWT